MKRAVVTGALGVERRPLTDPEAMLLVYDSDPEPRERDGRLDKRIRGSLR